MTKTELAVLFIACFALANATLPHKERFDKLIRRSKDDLAVMDGILRLPDSEPAGYHDLVASYAEQTANAIEELTLVVHRLASENVDINSLSMVFLSLTDLVQKLHQHPPAVSAVEAARGAVNAANFASHAIWDLRDVKGVFVDAFEGVAVQIKEMSCSLESARYAAYAAALSSGHAGTPSIGHAGPSSGGHAGTPSIGHAGTSSGGHAGTSSGGRGRGRPPGRRARGHSDSGRH